MTPADGTIAFWEASDNRFPGANVETLLNTLAGPGIIHFKGQNRNRCRLVTTLVHGNEPSGIKAIFRLLKEQIEPVVDIHCFIAAVETALMEPLFSYRQHPEGRDLNRCFSPPFYGREGTIARAFINFYESLDKPEALIDVHNTSGMGPPFAITRQRDSAHEALASFFTERLMVTGLTMSTLFEHTDQTTPSITVECGGCQDENADEVAYEGLKNYFLADNVLSADADLPMQILYEPARFEISSDATISYGFEQDHTSDLTLVADIEHHNLGKVTSDIPLGWVRPGSWDKLRLITPSGGDIKDQLLRLENNRLLPNVDLRLLMVTTNPVIAKSDCVFYAAVAD